MRVGLHVCACGGVVVNLILSLHNGKSINNVQNLKPKK